MPAKNLFEVIGVSTGRSWMSDNLIDVQYDLLLKDVACSAAKSVHFPPQSLDDDVEKAILQARALLSTDAADK